MKIYKLSIHTDGLVHCKSKFSKRSTYLHIPPHIRYVFTKRVNKIVGEIDSPFWGISYILSMYKYNRLGLHMCLDQRPVVFVNDGIHLKRFTDYACYLDRSYPLFRSRKTVRQLIEKGLKRTKIAKNADEIQKIFSLTDRMERQLCSAGNEIFNLMAAIGYAHGKQIFCFPWFSQHDLDGKHWYISHLNKVVEELELMTIMPVGRADRYEKLD